MKFNEKLILIMKCLKISNIELSKICKFDSTIISRYRCGNRIPTQNSITLNNLVNGICSIVLKDNKENDIYILCQRKDKDLFSTIMNWFCEDKSSIRLSKKENGLIGENLSTIMKLLNITNVELAKYLNKDYSIISKYKNNVTVLLKTDKTAEKICNYLIDIILKNNFQNLVTSLLDINKNSDIEIIKNSIVEYLFHNKQTSSSIDNFLESLNDFSFNSKESILPLDTIITNQILNDNKQVYIGTNEFRNSVKRFLSNIATNTTPTTLELYSDENLKWMIGNKEFFNTWKTLMITILVKKNKIRIVHNINRNPIEMLKAIEGWLPLYMTGLIEPYYCKKSLNNTFNHTIFLANNLAVISSFSIRGNENTAIYNYFNDKKVVSQYEKQFSSLLENCAPLVKIFVGNNINKKLKSLKGYTKKTNNNFHNIEILSKKDISTIILKTNTPSIMFEFEHLSMIEAFENYTN